ncbi:MAG TPA: glycosyltransferase [Flavobacteriales bacterium]|nr:glycosyltransferase [Flavobacteriales bacterium]
MISVVIPIFNEKENIDVLLERIITNVKTLDENYEIIFVDDGSTDSSLEQLLAHRNNNERIKILSLSRNFGQQPAYLAGLTHASGDLVCLMDGDLQDPPELLKEFYAKIQEGYDIVYAIRKKRKENLLLKFAYWIYYRILRSVSSTPINLDSGDFCMMKKNAVQHILSSAEQSIFLRGTRSWIGFKQIGIKCEREKRHSGKPKYTLRKLFELAYNGLFSFSNFPVKLITFLGFASISVSLIYLGFVIYKKIVLGDVPEGFTTLILAITLFSGVQLISIGLIGEYVLRIYNEARNRPKYIIKDRFFDKQE